MMRDAFGKQEWEKLLWQMCSVCSGTGNSNSEERNKNLKTSGERGNSFEFKYIETENTQKWSGVELCLPQHLSNEKAEKT